MSTRQKPSPVSPAVEQGERAEYLYKAFVLNRGFRPAKGYTGLWRIWYENGEPMSESTLLDNTRHGPAREWNQKGELIGEGEYRKGQEYNGTFADDERDRTRVLYITNGDLTGEPPPFINTPLKTD